MNAAAFVEPPSTAEDLADALQALLVDLDPALFQMDAAQAIRDAVARVRAGIDALLAEAGTPVGAAQARLTLIFAELQSSLPDPSSLYGAAEFEALHRELWPYYERISAVLSDEGVVVTPVRPHNGLRSVVHIALGLSVALAYETVMTETIAIALSFVWVAWAWSLEASRRVSPRINAICMTVFGPIAREHEKEAVNSATWFGTGIFLAAVLFAPLASVVGLIAAAVGDPAAGYVGRRWGRTRLYLGRSLEGSLGFAVATFAVAAPWAVFFHGEVPLGPALATAAAGAVVGAIVEHLSHAIDDNLAVTVLGGGAAMAVLSLLGAA